MIKIPNSNKLFNQPNDSDVEGNLFATFNCDFDSNQGAIRVAKRMILNTGSADVSEITGFPAAFKTFSLVAGAKLFTIAGITATTGFIFQGTSEPTGVFTKVATSPSAIDSAFSDLEVFNNELWVTPAAQNAKYSDPSDVGTFTSADTGSGDNTFPRPLCVFPLLNRIYTAISGFQVVSASAHAFASAGAANTMSIDTYKDKQVITFIKAGSNRLWIGALSLLGGKGYIYEWDGVSTQYNKAYQLGAAGALACVIKNDVPHVMDSNGNYLIWNGGTFVKVTGFNRKVKKQLYNPTAKGNYRFIHPNGMSVVDDEVHLNVHLMNNDGTSDSAGGSVNGTQEISNGSGIWVFNEETKTLKHKYSFGLSKSGDTIKDFGQFKLFGAGAISELINNKDAPLNTYNGQFLAGASYFTDSTTKAHGIFYDDTNDTLAKAGYFITPKIFAEGLQDTWVRAYLKYQKFLNASDKVVIKYRTVEDVPTETTITWQTTTSFSYPDSASAYVKGDEVEVIQGIGSGKCSHITAIQHGSGVYIVTVDETYTGATGTSKARLMKWKKSTTIAPSQDMPDIGKANFGEGTSSAWIQLKVWMSWTGANEINELAVINKKHKSYE